MDLSIVITVFNKEQYIRRCLESCVNQKGGSLGVDYELVIVNDGSSDGSQRVIDEYKELYPSIKVLKQENQGLSMARNNGLKFVDGKYVWFVDADDKISTEAYFLIKSVIYEDPDVIPIYAKYDGESTIHNEIPCTLSRGEDVLESYLWEECAPFYIINTAFLEINKISFIPGIYHEDSEFTPRMLCYAENVIVIPEILYTIFSVPNSITQVPNVKRAYDLVIVIESLESLVPEVGGYDTKKGKSLAYYIAVLINSAMVIIGKNNIEEQKKYSDFLYKHKQLFNTMFKAPQVKYRIESFLFQLFPKHSVGVYRIMSSFMRH